MNHTGRKNHWLALLLGAGILAGFAPLGGCADDAEPLPDQAAEDGTIASGEEFSVPPDAPLVAPSTELEDATAQAFSIGVCRFTVQLTQNVFTAIGSLTLTGTGCRSGAINNQGDQYNTTGSLAANNWYFVRGTSSIKPGQTGRVVLGDTVEHSMLVTICDAGGMCRSRVFNRAHPKRTIYIGKAYCVCSNGNRVLVQGTANGAPHDHKACTAAKKAAADSCVEETESGTVDRCTIAGHGKTVRTEQSTARCQTQG
jgi:hypothetical protein